MPKITKRVVDTIRPAAQRSVVWDDGLKGFGVVVRPSGVHSFVFSYRNAKNRKRNITIGKVGALTPQEARNKAEEYRHKVLSGIDPLDEKYDPAKRFTISDLIDEYLLSVAFLNKAESTRYIDLGRVDRHIKPLIGDRLVSEIDMRLVEKAFREIADGKTRCDLPSGRKHGRSLVKGGDGTARMAIRLFRAILGWGEKAGLVQAETVAAARHVDIGRDGRRDTILDDPKAYARLWETIDRLSDPGRIQVGGFVIRPDVADAIRLIILTGARKSEITRLTWDQIDLSSGIISLAPDRHKTGRKTGETRIIGLPNIAIDFLKRRSPTCPNERVFKPSRGDGTIELSKAWRQIREKADLPPTLGLHGLRHSLASHMAMDGASASEIMTALGHRDISTSQRYIHWAKDSRQRLAENAVSRITSEFSV